MKWPGAPLCVIVGTLLLAACTQLPIDGPHHRSITGGAATSLVSHRDAIVFDYALVDINKNVLEHQIEVSPGSFFKTFGAGSGPPPVIRVGIGDVVQASVFEFYFRRFVHTCGSGDPARQLRNISAPRS